MSQEIIRVENLSKLYRLGEINTGSISHDLNRWLHRIRGKADPYEKLAEINDRQKENKSGYVWSLRDVGFSINEGEVFGVIGKNGAGKSTLLRILSKITQPTRGVIKLGGRVSSLLEVGTGFHPDLSGRENIFLNGAILGMRRHEIKSRFDEIVGFSGVGQYIDTPVKRYSSGMFVRLAFAVAAHLEPEILIVDEVLAVGDAEFQQKCIGKMKDVSQKDGRTIIFVSHNMTAVKQLCDRAMMLEYGEKKLIGPVEKVLEVYQSGESDIEKGVRSKIPKTRVGYFSQWKLDGQTPADKHSCYAGERFNLTCRFECLSEISDCEFHIRLCYEEGAILLHCSSRDFSGKLFSIQPGVYDFSFRLELPVKQGKYDLEMGLYQSGQWIDRWASTTRLKVLDTFESHGREALQGILNVKTAFSFEEIQTPAVLQ